MISPAKRTVEFDPEYQEDPQEALTLAIRRLTIGERVNLADGTVVRSVGVKSGPGLQRMFVVLPPGAVAKDRHHLMTLERGVIATAQEAATKALAKTKGGSK